MIRTLLLAALALAAVAATPIALHEVRPGETLTLIAALRLGDAALWPALYRANRDQIRDPARLYPGQKLAIPTLSPAEREAVRREAKVLRPQ
ncbi:MAG: LysM peptidoglycan-binding domain-containing protein [Myxococcota bacterium]|nr:LysM peptidoglycan-binding domain-containing protein [Myxococcota bacterium]